VGYFKNQIIADQVEQADRVPAPRSSSTHVAFPTRRLTRQAERSRRYVTLSRGQYQVMMAWVTVIALGVGILVGVAL